MKEIGLFGITVPEEYGGMGADLVSKASVFEEISRGWVRIAGILGSVIGERTNDIVKMVIARSLSRGRLVID